MILSVRNKPLSEEEKALKNKQAEEMEKKSKCMLIAGRVAGGVIVDASGGAADIGVVVS